MKRPIVLFVLWMVCGVVGAAQAPTSGRQVFSRGAIAKAVSYEAVTLASPQDPRSEWSRIYVRP